MKCEKCGGFTGGGPYSNDEACFCWAHEVPTERPDYGRTYDVQHSLIVNKIHLHQTIEEPKDIPSAQIVSSYVRHTESGERRTSITIEWPEDCPAWIYHAVSKLCRVTVEPVDVDSPESAWASFLVAYTTPAEPTP